MHTPFPDRMLLIPSEKIVLEIHESQVVYRDRNGARSISETPETAIETLHQYAAQRGVEVVHG